MKYNVPKKIPIAFYNGFDYDYNFIINKLTRGFKKQYTCLGESTEKCITFTVPIEKEVTINSKNGQEVTKHISYVLQFIESARFMESSLSNLVNNVSEGIHNIKCKYGYNDKSCETCQIKYKCCEYVLEYTNFQDDLIECKCLSCNKNYQQNFDEKLKERFCKYMQIFSP